MNGKKLKPPKYYDKLQEEYSNVLEELAGLNFEYDYTFEAIKDKRKEKAVKYLDNNTPERLNVREKVQLARLNLLVRTVD